MWYEFNQNNSGGEFQIDNELAHHVLIEADSFEEANYNAEAVGMYFDGCDSGRDCPCCGDRWYPAWSEPDEVPSVYGETDLQKVANEDMFAPYGANVVILHYSDGSVERFTKQKRGKKG